MPSIRTAGAPLRDASTALVLVHGRGATAEGMLGLGAEVARDRPDVALIAPQAPGSTPAGGTWYPASFLAPLADNEPYLSAAIAAVVETVEAVQAEGVRVVLGGFSQGACLALEVAARHGAALGIAAAFGLSGALIGTSNGDSGSTEFAYDGRLDGVRVFAACDPLDAHVPRARSVLTAGVFERLGAQTDVRLVPGLGHTVSADEIAAVRALLDPA